MRDIKTDHSRKFTCIECGRDIVVIIGAARISIPGWFLNTYLRAVLDPDHDGKEYPDGR